MDNTLERSFHFLDAMPGNYLVFQTNGTDLQQLYYTAGVPALSGFTPEEYRLIKSPYTIIFEEDRSIIQDLLADCMKSNCFQKKDLLFRLIHKTHGFIWVHMTLKQYDVIDGYTVYIAGLLDVSKETYISYAMMDASDRYICLIEKSTKRFLYANSKFYALINSSPAEAMGKHCYELLCKNMEMNTNDNCLCYCSLHADPVEFYNPVKNLYLTITGREVVWGEYNAYAFYLTDITEQKRQAEKLEDSQKRFEVALANSDLMVWEYDMVNHRCINSEKAGRDYNIPIVIENYPESLFTTGHTPPETIAQIKDVKRRLENGETGFSVERRTIDKYGKSNWQKVMYTLDCDANGKPIRAIVCGLDITKRKELEQKYEEQMEYRNKLAQNAMFSIRMDLDSNTISDYTCSEPALDSIVRSADTADTFLTHFFSTSIFSADSELSQAQLTVAALKETYSLGQSQHQTVYRCLLLNLYLNLNLTMYKNPGSNHLELFFVITNVSASILMQNAFQRVVTKDYDFVALIDVANGSMLLLAHSDSAAMLEQSKNHFDDYNALVVDFANTFRRFYNTDEDFYAVTDGILLPRVIEKLENMPVYEFNCKTKSDDGQLCTYRLSFSYSDSTKTQIVFTRANITHVVQEEQRNQQALEQALQAAKAADQAKTDFLSRMSHDMRTPMNGIIGMTHLTQDIPNLSPEIQNNLAAISDSSDYLLQLINDTLDMNKIESNRFTLNPEVIDVTELIRNIIATITTLANAKKIHLEFVPINTSLDFICADRMRIQQIFMNILSNAVKFTPEYGKIRMEVECLKRENNIAYDRISIEDNGCGMSAAFLQHIFEPFSQEHTRIVSGQEGTGLGMSIVKNLVELMGGSIEITSKLGIGTKVTVYLNFTRVNDVPSPPLATNQGLSTALDGKRILLAEDHPLNATITKRLLARKHVLVEHAENGRCAVQMFSNAFPGYYDAILMDIRMPEMDGLEATQTIRTLDRADAKTIPILAMTANAYYEDIQAALSVGMNAHLSKPIDPEKLYYTLSQYLK